MKELQNLIDDGEEYMSEKPQKMSPNTKNTTPISPLFTDEKVGINSVNNTDVCLTVI